MSFAQQFPWEDRGRSEAVSLETSMFAFTVQLPFCNPSTHTVSVLNGGGFGMWGGNVANILAISTAVPFAHLTSQRLTPVGCALHGWKVALQVNRRLAKSAWQKRSPCQRNG